MANKAISELPQASNVNNQDLFVLEQSGIAKKLTAETFITEQGIIDALAEALDGHGGISSVTLSSVSGRIRTYLITFTDETTTTFQVYDGTSIERISRTSSSGLDDVYTVFLSDGTTTFFTVHNGADGTVSEAMLNDALKDKAPVITETTESSAVATFTDGADDMVMHNVVAEINPVQDLSNGDPSPSNICPITGWTGANVTRCGKLYDNYEDGTIITNGLTIVKSSNHRIKISGTVTGGRFDKYLSTAFVGTGETLYLNVSQPMPFTNAYYYVYDTTNYSAALRMYGATQTLGSFASVSGHSYRVGFVAPNNGVPFDMDFTVTITNVSPTAFIPISWQTEAGTVYGGTIDFATGLLTVTDANIASYNGETLPSTWISDRDVYASGTTPTTGAQVVYKLATPQTYQLTGQQLKTLYGTNNLLSNVGNVSVTYPADTKMFIEKLTMPTEDDLVANQAITSGQYFMIGNSLYLALANIASGAQITIGTNAQRVSLADALNAINS